MKDLDLVDPVQEAEEASAAAAPGLGRLDGRRIALLDNTKPGAATLLSLVGRELERRWRAEVELVAKASAALMEEPVYKDITARFHGIVTGIGD